MTPHLALEPRAILALNQRWGALARAMQEHNKLRAAAAPYQFPLRAATLGRQAKQGGETRAMR